MKTVMAEECEKCGGQIGTEHYVVCLDGITSKVVTFHKRCEPGDPDLQRHHGATLAPLILNATGSNF